MQLCLRRWEWTDVQQVGSMDEYSFITVSTYLIIASVVRTQSI
jgi:hypothetical protein